MKQRPASIGKRRRQPAGTGAEARAVSCGPRDNFGRSNKETSESSGAGGIREACGSMQMRGRSGRESRHVSGRYEPHVAASLDHVGGFSTDRDALSRLDACKKLFPAFELSTNCQFFLLCLYYSAKAFHGVLYYTPVKIIFFPISTFERYSR